MQPIQHYYYILRLWRVDQSRPADWRASLEIPGTGKRIGFASLEQLFAYLMELTENDRCQDTQSQSFSIQ